MMNWIWAFISLGCILSVEAALRDIMGTCCTRGRRYAEQDGVCADLEFFPFFDIQDADRNACTSIAMGCCDHEVPRLMCETGINQRAHLGSCSQFEGDNCYSVLRDCCNCCELGLLAYQSGAPCEITTLGEMCNHAFQTCCQSAFNEGDVDECAIPLDFGGNFNGGAGGRCSETCVNVIGDYKCECEYGKVVAADGYSCVTDEGPIRPPLPTERPYVDPCDTAPCTQECRSNTLTYQCSCRQGYRLDSDGYTCIDTRNPADLCATAPCNQDCQSNGVAYQCLCRQGYRLDSDGFTCVDARRPADLCESAPCDQECRSNGVAFECRCREGYLLDSDGFTCRAANPPANLCDTAPCTQDCQSNTVTYQCICRQGYQLESDGYTCREIAPVNLCETAPCTQDCQSNTVEYQCICRPGYQLERDGHTCRAVNQGNLCDTAPCTQVCRSNSATYQCLCDPGYLLNDDGASCRDENECVTGYYQCNPGEGCVNTDGGYRCEPGSQCEPGYQYSGQSGRCEDINECESDPNICELHQECINYDGHYYCNSICRQGYKVIMDERGGHTCQDVDECSLNLHNCAEGQRCDNLPGSFRCTRTIPCGTGYTINGQTQKCEDVDECKLHLHNCEGHFRCNNTLGSFRCEECPPGFRVAPSNVCNVDINECSDPNICQPGSRCDNTYGSYRCTSLCGRGMEFVSYLNRCMDIDECARGTHTCGPNQLCKNTMAGHSCQCKEGFNYDFETQTCNDIDECEEGQRIGRPKCRDHERCENVPGSHRCTPACKYGQTYKQVGNTWNCTDINECARGTHNCRGDEICVNDAYNGTYRCIRCTRGTRFNAAAKTCDDIDECNNPAGRVCLGICNNNPGSFFCTCPTGYNMIQSRVCRDIDECQVGNHRCRRDQLCFNTKGSHRCMDLQCPRYYNKRITGRQMRCDKIQRQLCPPPHQDRFNCAGNRTSPIIYFPLALRSYPHLPQGQDVLTLRIPAPSDIINFSLDYGNERRIFKVEKRQAAQTEGVLQLISPVRGPYETEVHMGIRTNVGSREQPQWVETSKAIILVNVSQFDF